MSEDVMTEIELLFVEKQADSFLGEAIENQYNNNYEGDDYAETTYQY